MEKGQIILEHTYSVPAEQVWEAITGPDYMNDPDYINHPDQTNHPDLMNQLHLPNDIWKVTEIVPGKRISYEWRYQGFPGNSRITFELVPDADGTRITITHTCLSIMAINLFA